MTTLFVTGSGTGIGKTFLCCRLLAALPKELRVRAIKPVVTGVSDTSDTAERVSDTSDTERVSDTSDTERVSDTSDTGTFDTATDKVSDTALTDTGLLIRAQGLPINRDTIAATSPWRFGAPLSADMAAAREGRGIDFDALVAFSRAPPGINLNLIEGIGGVMAPLDARRTVLDWIAALESSALLVVGSYLGALSHALTAYAALLARGIDVLAVVVSQSSDEPVPTDETLATLRRFMGATTLIALPRSENASAAEVAALVLERIPRS